MIWAGQPSPHDPSSRNELFGLLFAVCCINGLSAKAYDAVKLAGWWGALTDTFGISVVVWAACWAGMSLILCEEADAHGTPEQISRVDWAFATAILMAVAVPFGAFSWVALTGLALYVIRSSAPGSPRSRGAFILLAVTIPMCWSRLLFAFLARWILEADAVLVSAVTGTRRIGNTVQFAGYDDFFQIFPACSSLANMSLAILCWVTVANLVRHRASATDLFWCGLACLSVVAVNVSRISMIGFNREHFELLHGMVGTTLAGWLTLALMTGISLVGVRHDLARL